MNIYTCLHCEKEITKHGTKFCGSSYSAKYNNARRKPRSKTSKLKTSQSLKTYFQTEEAKQIKSKKSEEAFLKNKKNCTVCGREIFYRKTCSRECYNKHQSLRQTARLKDPVQRKVYRGNSGKSYMEESFENWLDEHYSGRYFTQIHFFNPETNKHGWADFVFPKEKIIFELDGTHHRKRALLDAIRDEYLERARGFKVYRITIHEYYRQSKLPLVKSLLNIS